MFIGGETELKKLNQMYDSGHFEFTVIYGRRRIGKTTLITVFSKNKKAIYYMSAESTAKENLESLSRSIFEVLVPNVEMPPFQNLGRLLDIKVLCIAAGLPNLNSGLSHILRPESLPPIILPKIRPYYMG